MRLRGMSLLALTAFLAGCGTMNNAEGTKALTLVKDGKPAAAIVVASEPTRAARLAALELQEQVKQITGAVLPVKEKADAGEAAVFVGVSDAAKAAGLGEPKLSEQEYVIKFIANGIILAGLDAPDKTKVSYDPEKPESWGGMPGFWEERGTLNAVYDFLERFCGVRYFSPTEFGTHFPKKADLVVSGKGRPPQAVLPLP